MTMPAALILSEMKGQHVRVLTLNRPAQSNALSAALLSELATLLVAAEEDDAIRAVVLAGGERVFSGGADIKEMAAKGFQAIDAASRRRDWDTIVHFRKPLIAAVEGIAYGGGHELVLLADIVVASENARFAQPEINIGILPGDGATQRLTRVVGKSLAMKMILTGDPIDARTAAAAGLVADVVAPGAALETAVSLANVIATKPPVAARLAKEAVLAAYDTHLTAGLAAERRAIRQAFSTEDQREGMAAFIGKRPAAFKGR